MNYEELLKKVDALENEPRFFKENDGWYVSAFGMEPWGPYDTIVPAMKAVVARNEGF